ncbi:22801_t:CDS:2 [Dentiscutata erythropus]|uniref:22801_t:CDS:1 n=1 Tax=Dentiscutata erythropus TaxID=1348616 RepID=A0A9N9DMW4_9GLOM|nr:22801_t:CDS:2 [Dentiscutata erythropus]
MDSKFTDSAYSLGEKNTSKNLKIYSVIANIIVTILIAQDIADVIYTIVNRQNYLDECLTIWLNSPSNYTSFEVNDICANSYNITLVTEIVGDLIRAIILIYFATVIASYAVSRKEKEMRNSGNSENNTGNSTENSTENNENVSAEKEKEFVKKLDP